MRYIIIIDTNKKFVSMMARINLQKPHGYSYVASLILDTIEPHSENCVAFYI